jgi:hypothetical protein
MVIESLVRKKYFLTSAEKNIFSLVRKKYFLTSEQSVLFCGKGEENNEDDRSPTHVKEKEAEM